MIQNMQTQQSITLKWAWVCLVASGIGSLTLIKDVTHAGGRRMTLKVRLKNLNQGKCRPF